MKKQFTLFTGLLLGACAYSNAQTSHHKWDFEDAVVPALPAAWTNVLPTGSTAPGWLATNVATTFINSLTVPAHTKYAVVSDAVASSNNDGVRLELTTAVDLSAKSNIFLKLDYFFVGGYLSANPNTKETATVKGSKDGGTTWADIGKLQSGGGWQTVYLDLAGYNVANVKLAIVYSDAASNMFGMAVDNIEILTPVAKDIQLTDVTPEANSPLGYGVVNGTKTLGGTVYNNGYTPITSFEVKYLPQGSATPVTGTVTGMTIAPFTSYDFTTPTAYAIPATVGNTNIDMWVELTGDVNVNNDSGKTTVGAAAFMPTKKIFIEEGTGTWCGWCPRGAVFMDETWKSHPENFSLVAAHNNDPMTISSYDNFMGSNFFQGYPSMAVDRNEVMDPSALPDVYNEMKDYFGFADVTVNAPSVLGENFYIGVKVKPAIDLSGEYRLGMIITEDRVHSETGSTWGQTNYYAGGSRGVMGGFENLPSTVPAKDMYYDFVARQVVGGNTGASKSLPATMTAGSTYDYLFTTALDAKWDKNKLRAVVFLMRSSDNMVLNSSYHTVNLSVKNVQDGISGFRVFPNPATENAYVRFTLANTSKVQIQVTDAMGRTVYATEAQMEAGSNTATITTSNFAAGLYNIKVITEQGSTSERLSVVK